MIKSECSEIRVGFTQDLVSAKKKRTPFLFSPTILPSVHTCKKSPFSVHTRPWFRRKKVQKRGPNRSAFTHAKNPRKSPSKKSPCLDSEKTEGFLHQRRTFFVRPKPFSVHTKPTRNRRNRLFLVHFSKLAFFFSPSKWDRFF